MCLLQASTDDSDDEPRALVSDYSAPIIENSDLPGLWGLDSMENNRVLLDTFSQPPVAFMIGPGGYELKLSPGSRKFKLDRAPSRHLLLPTMNFAKLKKEKKGGGLIVREGSGKIHLPVAMAEEAEAGAPGGARSSASR